MKILNNTDKFNQYERRVVSKKGIGLFIFVSKKLNDGWHFDEDVDFNCAHLNYEVHIVNEKKVIYIERFYDFLTYEQINILRGMQQIRF